MAFNMKIEWHTEKRKLGDLKVLENNPRKISDKDFKKLGEDIEEMGNFRPLIVDTENVILGGNQRYRQLLEKYGKDFEVEVSLPSRELSESERKKIIITDNTHRGDWDLDILGEDFGSVLEDLGFDDLIDGNDDTYTAKIEVPIYQCNDNIPSVDELVNKEKVECLTKEIEGIEGLNKEVKDFLLIAVTRFYGFNFSKIADFYAHSDENVKRVMEKLALVIVDYDKAIENGFVDFVLDIMEEQEEEYGDD